METKKKVFVEYARGVFPDTYLCSFGDIPVDAGMVAVKCACVKTELRGEAFKGKINSEWECMNIDHSRLFKTYLN